MFSETIKDQKIIYDSPVFRVEHLSVELSDGSLAGRDIVRHNGGVCIAAIEDNHVYMVEQYRVAVSRLCLELPAGKLEPSDTPESGALRELSEETGLTANKLIYLGSCLPSPGYTSEVLHLFLATGLKMGRQHLDEGEFLRAFRMPVREVMDRILDGTIQDAKTIICLFKAREYLRAGSQEGIHGQR